MKSAAIGIMGMINIRLYDIFRKDLHLPDAKAHELVNAIDDAIKGSHEENLKGVATMEFVKEEILATKEFVKEQIQATKDLVKSEVNRVELKVEQTKSDLTKAIFWTSLVQFLAIIGAVMGIISFMLHK